MDLSKIKEYLSEEGYRPQLDEDGDISFKSEGKYYIIQGYQNDAEFIRLIAPNLWEIDDPATLEQAYIQANKVTCDIKSAKVFVNRDETNVWASIELFMPDSEVFIAVFPRCLSALDGAVSKFHQAMSETVDEEEAEAEAS